MEDVRMQAVEMAPDKAIVSAIEGAIDAALAYVLQVEEIIRSTNNEGGARDDDLEVDPSQPSPSNDFQRGIKQDKGTAFCVAVDELEEMQLSLLEAARLAGLDSIREHDAQFAGLLANLPDKEWNETGDLKEDPFPNPPRVLDAVDVLSVLSEGGGSERKVNAQEVVHVLKRAKVSLTPSTDENPASSTSKGKKKVDESNSCISLNPSLRELVAATSEPDSETTCQICFDSEQTTCNFVTLEGCGHQFCAKCVKNHAEARVDGGQMIVTCLLDECPTLVSDRQLSSLLSSVMLDILARRQVEAAIPASEILYCPFRDCSALLMKPTSEPSTSARPPALSAVCVECEVCHRAFCMNCMVPWHGDKGCGEYRADLTNAKLQGDEKLLKLAKMQKWQRCTKCGRVVDLLHGCYHIRCLCRHEFCFICGVEMYGKKKKCTCPLWEEAKL